MAISPSERVRRLGVIGDVHGRGELLQRASDALLAHSVDTVVCVGDIYGSEPGTAACCRLLQERQIVTVRGNHDRWLLEAADCDDKLRQSIGSETLEFLSGLPVTALINTATGPALVCHGVGTNDLAHLPKTFPNSYVRRCLRLGLISPECRLVVHGHSHVQRHQTREGVLFVTVGALKSCPEGGCLIIDTSSGVVLPIVY
jgi:predicted phosphodiesterase